MSLIYEVLVIENIPDARLSPPLATWSEVFDDANECEQYVSHYHYGNVDDVFTILILAWDSLEADPIPTRILEVTP